MGGRPAVVLLVLLLAAGTAGADCAPEPLGEAGEFNLFILGDVAQTATSTAGRLAAGGSAQLASYSLGFSEPSPPGPRDALVVGGHLIFNNGVVLSGNIAYGLSATLQNVSVPHGTSSQATPIDFTAAGAQLEARSAGLRDLPAIGQTQVTPWGAITLSGSEPELNVFELAGGDLSQATSLAIQVPGGSTALVNVDGASVTMQSFGFSLQGASAARLLFNLHEATSLTMQGIGVAGSLLAPRADVQFSNGNLRGTLIAASLQGGGSSAWELFVGCLPPAGGGGDTEPPEIAILEPAEAVVVETLTDGIMAEYSDGESGIDPASVLVELDGEAITASCAVNPSTVHCDPPGLELGQHTILVAVSDLAGTRARRCTPSSWSRTPKRLCSSSQLRRRVPWSTRRAWKSPVPSRTTRESPRCASTAPPWRWRAVSSRPR